MPDKEKKKHHVEAGKDAYADEVSQETIDKMVSEIEGGDAEHPEGAKPRKEDHRGHHEPEELAKARQEAKDNYDRYVRSVAELDNFKKRMTKETDEYRKYANEELIKALLPTLDNLERAISHAEGSAEPGALLEGIRMVHKQLIDTLAKFGVEPIASLGTTFDPNFHQALMQVKTNESPPNTVVTEVTKGYLLNGRLIRPSMVGVSVREDNQPPQDSPWGDEEFRKDEAVPAKKAGDTIDDTE